MFNLTKRTCVQKRLALSRKIVHAKLMIQRNYHPPFFKKLLAKYYEQQAALLRQERQPPKI